MYIIFHWQKYEDLVFFLRDFQMKLKHILISLRWLSYWVIKNNSYNTRKTIHTFHLLIQI